MSISFGLLVLSRFHKHPLRACNIWDCLCGVVRGFGSLHHSCWFLIPRSRVFTLFVSGFISIYPIYLVLIFSSYFQFSCHCSWLIVSCLLQIQNANLESCSSLVFVSSFSVFESCFGSSSCVAGHQTPASREPSAASCSCYCLVSSFRCLDRIIGLIPASIGIRAVVDNGSILALFHLSSQFLSRSWVSCWGSWNWSLCSCLFLKVVLESWVTLGLVPIRHPPTTDAGPCPSTAGHAQPSATAEPHPSHGCSPSPPSLP